MSRTPSSGDGLGVPLPPWDERTVGDIGTIVGGSTPSRAVPAYWGGDIPWVTPSDLTAHQVKLLRDTRERITRAGLESCGARLLPAGTLLVTSRATLGAVAVASVPVTTNQGFKSIVFGPEADPDFYYHVFRRGVPQLTRSASGTTFLEISAREFRELRLPAPPLLAQRAIASILDTAADAAQQTERLVGKLERTKRGLLHDLLTFGIDDAGTVRDPSSSPDQFRHTALGLIPRAWKATSVRSVIGPPGTFIQTGPFGSQLHASDYVPNGVPVIMPQDIRDGAIDTTRVARIREEKARSLARHRIQAGDVIFARRGDLSKCAALTVRQQGWLCGTGCLLLRPPTAAVRADWLAAVYRHEVCQRQIAATAVGSTMVNLNSSILGAVTIPLPSIKEQDQILEVVTAHRRLVQAVRWELDKLKLVKQGLMADLLSGRVRPSSDVIDSHVAAGAVA